MYTCSKVNSFKWRGGFLGWVFRILLVTLILNLKVYFKVEKNNALILLLNCYSMKGHNCKSLFILYLTYNIWIKFRINQRAKAIDYGSKTDIYPCCLLVLMLFNLAMWLNLLYVCNCRIIKTKQMLHLSTVINNWQLGFTKNTTKTKLFRPKLYCKCSIFMCSLQNVRFVKK